MKQAWYLGHTAEQVSDRAILVGDPDRVDRIAGLMSDVRHLPVKRGLKTITGSYGGREVTVASFGMGAPIAAVVAHELADLGVHTFLRIGTAMYFPEARAGELIAAADAVSFEGTATSYSGGEGLVADDGILEAIMGAGRAVGDDVRAGRFATFDAFYRDMFALPGDAEAQARVAANRRRLAEMDAIAADMETSALLSAARALGLSCGSLCLGTVDGYALTKLPAGELAEGETRLFRIGLDALTSV